ncbi:LTA synthase family protein [Noviherbaspirillum massiliense]|uniref:LTA synthase family protein n=1 Tax=Noviherbaspirillum massiliense TaxID=1465823 RepID=UPI0002FDE303|nr:alkaline phosphatase family protein [Noviherbaspirillum massiliense]
MKLIRNIPLLPALVGAILLIIYAITRIGLAVYTGFDAVPLSLWPGILVKGLFFDLAVASALLAPVLLYEAIVPNRWRASRVHHVVRMAWLWGSIALLLFGAVAETTFWMEFSTRFNFIALDYLIYTHEVIGNILESYPVGWILGGIAALAALIAGLIRKPVIRADSIPVSRSQRLGLAISAIALPSLLLSFASIDQMEGQGNAYADELSGNGLFTLAAAMRRNELDYDKFYRTMPQDVADVTLKKLGVQRQPLLADGGQASPEPISYKTPFVRRPRNVVLISVESLSASYLGAYGSDKGLTPNLDEIARKGMKFEQVFATGTRTVRGLEALSLGTPPVPGQAIVRRPNNDHLATIGEMLEHQGFNTFFFYGGYGYFDNMNAYFSANDYRIVDRTDFPKETIMFENVWGVADEALFDNVLRTMDNKTASEKPFFAHVMTTSNHRPYTYPDGRIDIASPGGRSGAVKYTDYAIGKFLKDAESRPWFKDTLFVIVADHCASVAGKSKLPVESYHIPLIFYAPGLLKPGSYAPLMSQVDIAPTLLEVLGKKGEEEFFGRSVFAEGPAPQRAFISNYQELGYLRNGILTVLLPKKRVESYRIDPKTYASTPTAVDPQLVNETIAFYQTASRAFKAGALKAPYYVKH